MTASRLAAWRSVWVSGLLALLLALGVVPAAWADTIIVDGNCTDSNQADAICDDAVTYRTIAGAAAAANANDTLSIVTSSAHTEIGVTLTKTLTIQGQGAGTTIWQGAAGPGLAATRLVTINPGIQVTMTALTLQYGNVTGAGGAIYNRRGTLTLTSMQVLTNTSTAGGGAIYNEGTVSTAANVSISDTVFSGNRTLDTTFTALGGGALWNFGSNGTAIANITNSEFVSNTAGTGGGAIYSSNASGGIATLRVLGTAFYRNTGQAEFYGGGGALKLTSNVGINGATIESSQFISNTTAGGGGAIRIFSDAGTVTAAITGTTFSLNTGLDSFYSGGALFVDNDSTTVTTITSSEFLTNTTAGGGGAIYQKVNSGTATLTVTATLLRGNLAQEDFYGGGAIRNFSGAGVGTLYLIDSQVLTNTTNAGGAIHNDSYGGTAITHISGSDLISNTAGAVGGAVWNTALDAGSVAVTGIFSSTLAYNQALDGGGGIYNDAYNRDGGATATRATVLVTDTAVYSNTVNNPAEFQTGLGGGVYSQAIDTGAFAIFTAHNSTFSGNSADGAAGGLYNLISNRDNFTTTLSATASAVMTLTHVTVANNTSGSTPGGLYADGYDTDEYGAVVLRNSLVTGNTGSECSGSGDKLGTHNFIDDTTCGSGAPFRLGSAAGTLLALADNGGPTLTHALTNAGPAVDAASGTYCPAADQRGTVRPQGAGCDVGAWEGAPETITLFIAADPPDGTAGQPYTYTVTANGFPVTFTVQSGTLPPGLTLATSGVLSGTPSTPGTYSGIVFRAQNLSGTVDASPQTIVIADPIIVTANPPDGQVGLAYNHTVTATGAVISYTVTGTLPPGLTFSTSGVLSGTPTVAGTYGGLVFRARNGALYDDSDPQTIVITQTVTIVADPPDAYLDEYYEYYLGGTGNPITFTLQAGTLPPGLTLYPNGELSGSPNTPGVYSGLVFRADDGWDTEDSSPQTIIIIEQVTINATPPDGEVGVAYNYTLGGTGNPITFTLQAGTLPPGLTLSLAGELAGTPTTPGTYSGLVFRADNGFDTDDTEPLEITITGDAEYRLYLPLVISPPAMARGRVR